MNALHSLGLTEAAAQLGDDRLHALDYAEALVDRIAKSDRDIDAWVYFNGQHMRQEAQRCDALTRHERGPLQHTRGWKDITPRALRPHGSAAFDTSSRPPMRPGARLAVPEDTCRQTSPPKWRSCILQANP